MATQVFVSPEKATQGASGYEPKRVNRWVVNFPSIFKIESWVVNSTQRPSIILDGDTFKINPINFVFLDPIGPSTAQRLMDIIRACPNNIESLQKDSSSELIEVLKNGFDYDLEMLDPTGVTVEKWTISNCEIISVDFSDLNYSESEPIKFKMIVQPKSFKLHF